MQNPVGYPSPLPPCEHEKPGRWQLTGWSLIGLCGVAYLATLIPFLINVPQGDDLISVLPFIEQWTTASTADRISALFAQYFSHRIVLTKLVAVAVYATNGHLNLVVMQAIGLTLWTTLALVCTWYGEKQTREVWHALPVALLLLNPKGMTNILIAMQGVQNIGILVLAALAIVLAGRKSVSLFFLGLLMSAAAVFCSANGLMLPPILTLLLILKKDYARAAVCFISGSVLTACYFHGFSQTVVTSFSLSEFTANIVMMIGGPFRFDRLGTPVTELIGATLLIAAVATLYRNRHRFCAEPMVCFLLFLLATVLMAAFGRIGWGAGYMLQDRYSPYGLLIATCTWTLNISPRLPKVAVASAIGAAALVCICAYISSIPTLVESDRVAQTIIINHQLGANLSRDEWSKNAANQQQGIAAHVLRLPQPSPLIPSSSSVRKLAEEALHVVSSQKFMLIRDTARAAYTLVPAAGWSPESTAYSVLLTPAHVYILAGGCTRRSYLNAVLQPFNAINTDRAVYIWPINELHEEPFAIVGVTRAKDNCWTIVWRGDVSSPTSPSAL